MIFILNVILTLAVGAAILLCIFAAFSNYILIPIQIFFLRRTSLRENKKQIADISLRINEARERHDPDLVHLLAKRCLHYMNILYDEDIYGEKKWTAEWNSALRGLAKDYDEIQRIGLDKLDPLEISGSLKYAPEYLQFATRDRESGGRARKS